VVDQVGAKEISAVTTVKPPGPGATRRRGIQKQRKPLPSSTTMIGDQPPKLENGRPAEAM
jgi:hypothetical protein